MATKNSLFPLVLFSVLLPHLCLQRHVAVEGADREALEIGIGGGGINIGGGSSIPPASSPEYPEYCPPPPPPPCPPPPSPPPPPPCPPPPSPPSPPPCPPPPSPPSPPPPSPPPPPPSPPPPPPPSPSPPPPPPPSPSPPPPPPPSPRPSPSPFPPNDRLGASLLVIQRFKKLITDDPKNITRTWVGSNPCKYKGFSCNIDTGYPKRVITGVDFNGFGFAGKSKSKLPLLGFMDELPDLVFFHANSNNFTGRIPEGISKIKYFYELDVSNNKLTGDFPYEVLGATQLTFLDLRFNFFTGSVPPQVFFLDVDVLFINNNNLGQRIPDALGSTPAHYLTFANNQFYGPIPKSIGHKNTSERLYEVLFLNNRLSGCLPMEIGNLKEAVLFDVSSNYLTGPIPQSFACLTNMELLRMANNQFYGEVPELVCKLSHLRNLSLANNYFTQVGKECRKLIHRGVLDVKNNCILDLPNQRSKTDCAWFFSKRRSCPDERSMQYIPCKGRYLNEMQKKPEPQRQASASLTYGTLVPHRL